MIFEQPGLDNVEAIVRIVRDIAFFGGILIAGWKARDFVQPIYTFFTRVNTHMTHVEITLTAMNGTLAEISSNHLTHIEEALTGRSHHKSAIAIAAEEIVPGFEKDSSLEV